MAKQTGPIDLIRRFKNAGALRKAGKIAKATAPELKAVAKARTTKRAEAAARAAAKNAPAPTAGVKDLKEIKVTGAKPTKANYKKAKIKKEEYKDYIYKKKSGNRALLGLTGFAGGLYGLGESGLGNKIFGTEGKKQKKSVKTPVKNQKTKVKKLR